jgi:predicted AAA+ superfamily ATPase
MNYQHRIIEPVIQEYLKIFPVLGLTGPRQSGKSTLLQNLLPDYQYVTFDDYRQINLFQQDPIRFLELYPNNTIFDEVQKVPELFNFIKMAVDKHRHLKGRYILTGSSQFTLLKNISESLAGRIGLLTLLPFQSAEIPNTLRQPSIYSGAYPELVERSYQYSQEWYASYIETYIHKDIAQLGGVGDLRDFRHLINLLAANTSQILNMSRFANDIGVDVKTIQRWLSILEASYIIFLLPPFYDNLGKRIVKSPKIYFYDTGIVSFLTGIETQKMFEQGPLSGAIFENYVISEILKREKHQNTNAELYYYRTSNGQEVDLIIDRKAHREWIEIKSSKTFHPRMMKTLENLVSPQDLGYLIYQGEAFPYYPPLKVVNTQDYLSNPDL